MDIQATLRSIRTPLAMPIMVTPIHPTPKWGKSTTEYPMLKSDKFEGTGKFGEMLIQEHERKMDAQKR